MKVDKFPLRAYCARIHDDGDLNASVATVNRLMRQQLCHVPFENLDVLQGRGISLQPKALIDKIIGQERGGYCFEVNGIFALLLDALNIPYRMLAARPLVGGAERPKTHMALAIELEDRLWLCDLGYGRYGIRELLDLSQIDVDIPQQGDLFRLSRDRDGIHLLQAMVDGAWMPQIEFDLTPQRWIDFEPANHYTSTHPDSIFVNQLLVILFTENGRKVLNGDQLKILESGQMEVRQIDPDEIESVLENEFGLAQRAPSNTV
jgi:N-hydroxyarylamine O-acetyltransferase